jgi:hypothetical protein
MNWYNSLIYKEIFMLKFSSFCHNDGLVRLCAPSTQTCPQSYPQILCVKSAMTHARKQDAAAVKTTVCEQSVSHNPAPIICLEMCIVFDHTSCGLADLALGSLFHSRPGADH